MSPWLELGFWVKVTMQPPFPCWQHHTRHGAILTISGFPSQDAGRSAYLVVRVHSK